MPEAAANQELQARIENFIRDPSSGDFDALSRAAEEANDEPEGDPPRHQPEAPEIARHAVNAAMAAIGCLPATGRPVLAAAPQEGEGVSPLAELMLANGDSGSSIRPFKGTRPDVTGARSWLAARQRDGRPMILAGLPEHLDAILSGLERRGLRFRMPAGSSAIGLLRNADQPSHDLAGRLTECLALSADQLFLAYEAAGAATPLTAAWGVVPVFQPAPWTRLRVLDPTGAEAGPEQAGRLEILDLANLGGPLRVLTERLAAATGEGFRLLQSC